MGIACGRLLPTCIELLRGSSTFAAVNVLSFSACPPVMMFLHAGALPRLYMLTSLVMTCKVPVYGPARPEGTALADYTFGTTKHIDEAHTCLAQCFAALPLLRALDLSHWGFQCPGRCEQPVVKHAEFETFG